MHESKIRNEFDPILPEIPFTACPIRASLGVLGRKWTLLILRDMTFLKNMKFSQILRSNPGLTPRALSIRLRDLQREGLIDKIVNPKDRRGISYRLTQKGKDSTPILTAFIQYGMRHHAKQVFEDGKPRRLTDVFPQLQSQLLGKFILAYANDTKSSK
jgi:DNA-binding HxlR family transcriptional regulator